MDNEKETSLVPDPETVTPSFSPAVPAPVPIPMPVPEKPGSIRGGDPESEAAKGAER